MKYDVTPTGVERSFAENEFIVSRTDLKGRLTYCNDVFLRLAGYKEEELLHAPHSIIRHPAMPRCVFKLLWDTLADGKEIFAYVVNMSKNGDHYWVFAHITPTFNTQGQIIGYHSNRRKPKPTALDIIRPLYKKLCEIEQKHSNAKDGMKASFDALVKILEEKGVTYDEFILTL